MSKHTPGPWTICYDGDIESESGINICVLRFGSYKEYNDNPEMKANARLIASAPELLEACKEAKRMYDEVQPAGGWQGVDDLLISAITKAEGGSNEQ